MEPPLKRCKPRTRSSTLEGMTSRLLLALCSCAVLLLPIAAAAQRGRDDLEPRTDAYTLIVERAVDTLARGDAEGFKKLLSRNLIAETERELGRGKVDFIINERFIPFFSDLESLDSAAPTTSTRDAHGSKGIAVFRTFVNKEGLQKPFVIYVLDEDGKLVIGNLLLNKSMSDVLVPRSGQGGDQRRSK